MQGLPNTSKSSSALRKEFVFDNVAVYLQDESNANLEVTYTRAPSGARRMPKQMPPGARYFAGQVVKKGNLLVQDPKPDVSQDDRLHQAYLLGLPIAHGSEVKGALVFVRFGGPVYEDHISTWLPCLRDAFHAVRAPAWQDRILELQDLKRQMQLQEDFVSTISHELRTPLGFIKGYSTSLLREDTSWDEETQRNS